MASKSGDSPADLTLYAQLTADPGEVHIFLALRVLEVALQKGRPLGRTRLPGQDRIRLGQDPHLGFARQTISGFVPPEGDAPARLRNLAFGLWGPMGPLPLHLTEYAHDRLTHHRDPTLVAFADMITHRMLSLFYRAWAEAQPAVALDQGAGRSFDLWVGSIAGIAGPALSGRDAMPDRAKRHCAASMMHGPRTAEGLQRMVAAFLAAPVEVEEFVGSWLPLAPDDRWCLGQAALGRGTVVGSRVWSRTARVRLRLGPLDRAAYDALLPGGAVLEQLVAVVRNYLGLVIDFDLNLVLRAADVPQSRLDGLTRLGQTSWLGRRRQDGDAADLVLPCPEHPPPMPADGIVI